jgi:hypothetical protein
MGCDCRELCRPHGIPEEHSGRVHNLRAALLTDRCARLVLRLADNCGTDAEEVMADLRERGERWTDGATLEQIESACDLLLDWLAAS